MADTAATAAKLKAEGNTALQANDVDKAIELYKKGLKCSPLPSEDENALNSNLALCYLKKSEFEKAADHSSRVLRVDPMNAKALYRRCKAYTGLGKLTEAAMDAKALQRYHPQNPQTLELIKELTFIAKNSESGARKALSDACKDGADTVLLKQILGAVAEDEGRAKEVVSHDGVDLLLKHATKDPLVYNVLGRLVNYDSTFPVALQAIKKFYGEEDKWSEALIAVVKDEAMAGLHSGAAILVLKCCANKGAFKIENPVFVESLLDPRPQVREMAVDACCHLYSKTRESSELFVKDLNGIESLREVCREEQQLASLCLSRIVPILIRMDKSKDDLVAERCGKLCAPAFAVDEDLATMDSIRRVKAGLNALLAVFNAGHEVGLEVVGKNSTRLGELITKAPDSIVTVVAEILAQTGNSEGGRAVLSALKPQLHTLLIHSLPGIRAAASVALTKIEAVNFDTNSEEGELILGSVGHMFREGASPEEIARGIEAVSFVVADTDVKMMLTTGTDGTRVLKSLMARAKELKEQKDNSHVVLEGSAAEKRKKKEEEEEDRKKQLPAETVFGIAYLLQNLTMDEDDKKREKLREMEVSQEQWEQFEKITKQKSRSGNSRQDSPEEVAQRIDAVVTAGGVTALRHLVLNRPTPAVAGAVAKALLNMASQARVRGTMIAQGAISCLLKTHKIAAKDDELARKKSETYRGSPMCRDAAHAIARLLITTDPRLLPDAQIMDSLTPLVEQVRKSDEDLVVFECLMALTNLATVGDQVKDKIVTLKGLHAFEYAQFSETPLVRRAATEALANLVPCDGIVEWLRSGDKARLWILLAEDYKSDMATARASSGALAQLAADERIASRLRRFGAAERLSQTVLDGCPYGEIAWRIAVTLSNLSEADFVDTSDEAKNEGEGVSVTGDGKWHAATGPWTEQETQAVRACMEHIVAYKAPSPQEKEFWASAAGVAKDWLASQKKKKAAGDAPKQ